MNENNDRKKLASLIIACFKSCNWARNTFSVGGEFLKNPDGEKYFYSAKDIDKAIKKLNRIIRLLNK